VKLEVGGTVAINKKNIPAFYAFVSEIYKKDSNLMQCKHCMNMIHSKFIIRKQWSEKIMSYNFPDLMIDGTSKLFVETYICESCGTELNIVKTCEEFDSINKKEFIHR